MSRIFISGSSTGLGLMAADLLVSKGHSVVLHARNAKRAEAVRQELTQAEATVVGDVETISGAKEVAAQVNALGHFDTVIHNAAVGYREGHRVTADGLPHVFAINTLSAYILTALIERPKRLVYLSSGMHHHADANLDDSLEEAPLERFDGLRGEQASRYDAGLRHCTALAGRLLERAGARMGADQDGRFRRARRHGSGASDPGLARCGRRYEGRCHGSVFLSPEAHGAEPAVPRRGSAGPPHRDLLRNLGSAAAGVRRRTMVLLRERRHHRRRTKLLQRLSPLLAQSGHSVTEFRCPLLGVKRTLRGVQNVIPIPDVIGQEYSFLVTFLLGLVRWRST